MEILPIHSSDPSDGVTALSFKGDMTIYTAEDMHRTMTRDYKVVGDLHLYMEEVEEVDTAGLQLLLALQRQTEQLGHSLILNNVSASLTEAFEIMSLLDRFDLQNRDLSTASENDSKGAEV